MIELPNIHPNDPYWDILDEIFPETTNKNNDMSKSKITVTEKFEVYDEGTRIELEKENGKFKKIYISDVYGSVSIRKTPDELISMLEEVKEQMVS